MASYYGPDEDTTTILLERTFVAGVFICGVGYGVQLVLYTTCFRYLWSTRKHRRQSIWLLAYISTLLCIESVFEADQARTVQDVYIDNRNYPGGPWVYFLHTQNLPVNVIFIAMLFVLTFLADMLVLWRCWVIWASFGKRTAYLIIAFPALMLLASFVMGTLWTFGSSQPGLTLYSKLSVVYGTSYQTISLSINVVLTILITIRLLMHRRKILVTLPEDYSKHYISLITIIVESAALYSVFAVVFLITYAVNNPLNQVFLNVASSSQQIANYLIICRIAEGKAWGKDTLVQQTTLRFRAARQITTMTTTELGMIRVDDVESVSTGNIHAAGGEFKRNGPEKPSGSSMTAL